MRILTFIKRCLNRLSKESKAAIGYTTSNIAQKAVSIVLVPIYVRLMTMDEYGTYSYYQSLIPFLMIFCTFNITGPAIYKGLNKYKENSNEYISNALGVITFLSSMVFLTFIIGYFFSYSRMKSLVGIDGVLGCACIVDVWAMYVCSLWRCKNRYDFRYKPVILMNYMISFSGLALGILAVYGSTEKLYAVIICRILIQVTAAIYSIIDILKHCHILFKLDIWKYIFGSTLPLLINIIALRIVQRADYRVIFEKCSSSDLAIYSFAYSLTNLLYIFSDAFDNTLSPMVTHALSSKSFGGLKKESKVLLILFCGIGICLCMICPEVVAVLGTKDYYESVFCIMPLVMGLIIEFITNLLIYTLVFYGCNKMITFASVLVATLNVSLNLIFVPIFGFIAAAYTTLASYLAYLFIVIIFYTYTSNKNVTKVFDLKFICCLLLGCAILVCCGIAFVERPILRLIMLMFLMIYICIKGIELIRKNTNG